MNGFTVTYTIVTPESAECGEAESCGFVTPGGWRVDALIGQPTPGVEMRLRDALQLCSPQEDSGSWFSEIDGVDDYRTGANEVRSLHPPRNISAASYARLKRFLAC